MNLASIVLMLQLAVGLLLSPGLTPVQKVAALDFANQAVTLASEAMRQASSTPIGEATSTPVGSFTVVPNTGGGITPGTENVSSTQTQNLSSSNVPAILVAPLPATPKFTKEPTFAFNPIPNSVGVDINFFFSADQEVTPEFWTYVGTEGYTPFMGKWNTNPNQWTKNGNDYTFVFHSVQGYSAPFKFVITNSEKESTEFSGEFSVPEIF